MNLYYITNTNWLNFLHALMERYPVYGLMAEGNNLLWKRIDHEDAPKVVLGEYRATHSLKTFVFPIKEEVTLEPVSNKTVVIGAKACDLAQLKTSDAIFNGGLLIDPYYAIKRQNSILISTDCGAILPSCFCGLMGGEPHSLNGFDLNVSPLNQGFIVETGSDVGRELVLSQGALFGEPSAEQMKEREDSRRRISEELARSNREYTWTNPNEVVGRGHTSAKWKEIAAPCVECDACRFACGSCYCFLLSETAGQWERVRAWDSCQSEGYARVAGGANPKKTKWERLRNMYACKLLYRYENQGFYACTGCGRCIDVCQGRIDIRKSLQKLQDEQQVHSK